MIAHMLSTDMKIVLDTNVLVSAMLGSTKAPRRVLRLCLEGQAVPLVGAALFAEYEDVLSREALFARSPLAASEREEVFDALMSVTQWVPVHFLWRPNLRDEGDNHLIELAIAGGGAWIVTANLRDFAGGELRFDRLRIGTAGDFLIEWSD